MNEHIGKRNRLLAARLIRALERRNMTAYYAEDREQALAIALTLIPRDARVGMGGGMSVHEIGLSAYLRENGYLFVDRGAAAEKKEAAAFCFAADVFLSGVNALTEDGILVNIDANGNRVAAIAQGPEKVVFIVGMNKVCRDLDSALKRAQGTAAPINAQRFRLSTPCAAGGACMDCLSPDTLCCQFLITRYSRHPGRIHVILVNDSLGF